MNHLAKHIETLVWQHECVIVPQFGGFVTQVQSAYTTDSGDSFMPPARTVGFNDKLFGNDGILVHSYMETYGLQEAEAKRLLQSDILDMREQLLHQGSYNLGRLGVLEQDEDGGIHFLPNNGWAAPEFFGLEALDFPRLEETATVVYPQNNAATGSEHAARPEHITLNINRRMLHTAISVAAAILLFFMVSTPVNTNIWYKNQALLAQDILTSALNFMPRMETRETAQPDTIGIGARPITPVSGNAAPKAAPAPEQEVQATDLTHEFAVVIASAVPESNARDYVAHLHKKGYTDACIHQHGAMVRVLFRGFATETEAKNKMQALQSVPEFRGAWILQMK